MVKTTGSVDRVSHRKRRIDKGKRRKFYRGKPVKKKRKYHGKLVPYVSHRNPGDPLKLYFWKIDRMSVEGLHHWNRKIRTKVHRNVYGKNRVRIDAYPDEINNRENLARFCEEVLYQEGNWLMLMWTHRRNKYHCSARAVAVIHMKETSEGMKARVVPSYKNRSIGRYSWWQK